MEEAAHHHEIADGLADSMSFDCKTGHFKCTGGPLHMFNGVAKPGYLYMGHHHAHRTSARFSWKLLAPAVIAELAKDGRWSAGPSGGGVTVKMYDTFAYAEPDVAAAVPTTPVAVAGEAAAAPAAAAAPPAKYIFEGKDSKLPPLPVQQPTTHLPLLLPPRAAPPGAAGYELHVFRCASAGGATSSLTATSGDGKLRMTWRSDACMLEPVEEGGAQAYGAQRLPTCDRIEAISGDTADEVVLIAALRMPRAAGAGGGVVDVIVPAPGAMAGLYEKHFVDQGSPPLTVSAVMRERDRVTFTLAPITPAVVEEWTEGFLRLAHLDRLAAEERARQRAAKEKAEATRYVRREVNGETQYYPRELLPPEMPWETLYRRVYSDRMDGWRFVQA